jgi:hypothetical protein
MKIDQIRAVMHAAPFQPFIIHVADGNTAAVPHPDFIAIHGNRAVIVTSPDSKEPAFRMIDGAMITQLEISGTPANGAKE